MDVFGFIRSPEPKKQRKTVKAEKSAKHVLSATDKVCFSLPGPKPFDRIWHMGEIVAIIPPQDPNGKATKAWVAPFQLVDPTVKVRAIEDWETDAPPYFHVSSEVLILDRLLSQLEWHDKKLAPLEVDLDKMCLARHTLFVHLIAPLQTREHTPYKHRW